MLLWCTGALPRSPRRPCSHPPARPAAGGQGAISTDDVAQAVLFCFRLSKNAVPEEVSWAGSKAC